VEAVPLAPRSTERLSRVLDPEDLARFEASLSELRHVLMGRRVWHVNSTRTGGGVAEILNGLLPYACGAGIDVRWLVVDGNIPFFDVTKRLHHRLHEQPGDGGPLGTSERVVYDHALEPSCLDLLRRTRPGDVAVLHDPQTAGLVPPLVRHGVHVVWRCHVGIDDPGPLARSAWDFLRDDVSAAAAVVFSRASYVWDGLDSARSVVMAPCIDVLATKNDRLPREARDAILRASGIVPQADGTATPQFVRTDGSLATVRRAVRTVEDRPTAVDAPIVVQVSRWDPLKDPVGVLRAFGATGFGDRAAELVLAGPDTESVTDDPEGSETFAAVVAARATLDPELRARVHLVTVPMDDVEENAAVVNALQSRADVVLQKSLAEGFGLTVAEAMWKRRPVVASRVGGIQDQIVDGESGILLDDPSDAEAAGQAVAAVLQDRAAAEQLGARAHRRVCESYLPSHHFAAESALFERILA
jgi:trehalose synthase